MWSRKFIVVGISSAVVFAGLSVSALWLLFFLALNPAGRAVHLEGAVFLEFSLLAAIGVIVYPACWFFMIQRSRNYGRRRAFELLCVTYGISCLVVAGIICLATAAVFGELLVTGIYKMTVGSISMNWEAIGGAILLLLSTPLLSVLPVAAGATIVFPIFVAVATPAAFLHRWLLVTTFGRNGGSAPPERAFMPAG